jgi:hypothetical protein
MTEKKLTIVLEGDVIKSFEAVKEHLGMKRNSAVLCVLIAERYHQIQQIKMKRLPIDDETYRLLEEGAKKEGCTPDEYANRILENFMMKLAKADPKAAIDLLKQQREAEKKQKN